MFRIYSSIAMRLNIFMRVKMHINFVEFKVKIMKFSVTSTQINLEPSRLLGKFFSTFLKFNHYRDSQLADDTLFLKLKLTWDNSWVSVPYVFPTLYFI